MFCERKGPSDKRDIKKAVFGHPFELRLCLVHDHYIGETLMVRHYHISPVPVDILQSGNLDLPIGIQRYERVGPPEALGMRDPSLSVEREEDYRCGKHGEVQQDSKNGADDPDHYRNQFLFIHPYNDRACGEECQQKEADFSLKTFNIAI